MRFTVDANDAVSGINVMLVAADAVVADDANDADVAVVATDAVAAYDADVPDKALNCADAEIVPLNLLVIEL